jgi:hypothetical protein
MKRRTSLCLGFLLLPVLAAAQQAAQPSVWAPWQFLLGRWTAEASGEPGAGKGTFSFALELQGKILVRRSRTDFPATPARAASPRISKSKYPRKRARSCAPGAEPSGFPACVENPMCGRREALSRSPG